MARLLPGAVTLLVPSGRFPLAGGDGTLGVRVPDIRAGLRARAAELGERHRGPDARRLEDVPESIRGALTSSSTGASCPARRRPWSISGYDRGGDLPVVRWGLPEVVRSVAHD